MSKKEPVILPGDAVPALYSPAVRIEHTLYVSGQVGEDTQGCVPDGIEAQTALAIENAAKLIEAAGATLKDVLMCRCFLQKKEDFAGMNAAYSRYFGGADPVIIDLGQGEYCANRRLHLVALLCDLFLQVLRIVDTDYLKSGGFIYAEQQHAAAVLVGEAGQRIIQSFRTIHMSRLAFDRLRLGFLFANSIC